MQLLVELRHFVNFYKYQLSLNSGTRCIRANVLQTKMDAQCDKFATELS